MRYLVLAVCLLFFSAPAWADAIDGQWCHQDGRRLSINGPTMVLPSGKRIEGDYDRHGFRHTDDGVAIVLQLLGENHMHRMVGTQPHEDWRRCGPPIS